MRQPKLAFAFAFALTACSTSPPRFGLVHVSAESPRATLTGRTHATSPAIDLSAGCPGFLDPSAPDHVIELAEGAPTTLVARSDVGPLSLAVVGPGEVRCDSDGGSGHAPRVALTAPGTYAVHVGALAQGADLPYELVVSPGEASPNVATGAAIEQASVTITSDPPGATVRTPEGQLVGTTPAMFALPLGPGDVGQERRYVLEMPGRQSAEVTGRLVHGALVLHAALASNTGATHVLPTQAGTMLGGTLVVSTTEPQRIRDYGTARQAIEVARECTISDVAVDVDIQHSFVPDLAVVLRSPGGMAVTLHDHSGGNRANILTTFDVSSRRGVLRGLIGQSARGRWELSVRDDAGGDTGTMRGFTLRFACQEGGGGAVIPLGTLDAGVAPITTGGADASGNVVLPRESLSPRRTRSSEGGELIDPFVTRPGSQPMPLPDRQAGPRSNQGRVVDQPLPLPG